MMYSAWCNFFFSILKVMKCKILFKKMRYRHNLLFWAISRFVWSAKVSSGQVILSHHQDCICILDRYNHSFATLLVMDTCSMKQAYQFTWMRVFSASYRVQKKVAVSLSFGKLFMRALAMCLHHAQLSLLLVAGKKKACHF